MNELFCGDLGPCVLVYDPAGENLVLDASEGGNVFESDLIVKTVGTDQAGEVPVDRVTMGRNGKLTAKLTKLSLEQLEALIHGSTLSGSKLTVKNDVGTSLFSLSKELVVKRIKDGVVSTTPAEWIHLLRTYPQAKLNLSFDKSSQRTAEVVFDGFPDDTSGYVGVVWMTGKTA